MLDIYSPEPWHLVSGCAVGEDACRNCWSAVRHRAAAAALRHGPPPGNEHDAPPSEDYAVSFATARLHPDRLTQWLRHYPGAIVEVTPDSDLFQAGVHTQFIKLAFQAMVAAPQHHYLVCTRAYARVRALAPLLPWAPHIALGLGVDGSAGEQEETLRWLQQFNGPGMKYLVAQPLLTAPAYRPLAGIDWLIMGNEAGIAAPPELFNDWALSLYSQALAARVPVWYRLGYDEQSQLTDSPRLATGAGPLWLHDGPQRWPPPRVAPYDPAAMTREQIQAWHEQFGDRFR